MEDLEHGNPKIEYPEDLTEQQFGQMIQGILDGIDRDKLFGREDLVRARHPLVQQQLGRDVALNVEIHNMITAVVSGLTASEKIGNRAQLKQLAVEAEAMLVEAAKNPTAFRAALESFKAGVVRLDILNPSADFSPINPAVSHAIRERITMPSIVQEYIVYPAVHEELYGGDKDAVTKMARDCRDSLLLRLEGETGENSERLRQEIQSETAAVLGWYEKTAA